MNLENTERTPSTKRRGNVFRFSLRTLLIAFALIAILIPIGKVGWRAYVIYREGQAYSVLRAAKAAFVENNRASRGGKKTPSRTVDDGFPIPDGFAVLVRKGNVFGCFVPKEQYVKGESLKYEWFYRTDGLGVFDLSDSNVQHGESFAGPYVSGSGVPVLVMFGPFSVEWSGNEKGWGYLYYENSRSHDCLRICTTNRQSVAFLDARSPEWIFKRSSQDDGVRGDQAIPTN